MFSIYQRGPIRFDRIRSNALRAHQVDRRPTERRRAPANSRTRAASGHIAEPARSGLDLGAIYMEPPEAYSVPQLPPNPNKLIKADTLLFYLHETSSPCPC